MTENKRYIVKGSDDFFLHIEDTTFTEDKHEGVIYNIYQAAKRLNEQDERIKKLEEENKLKGDFRNFVNEDIVRIKKENEQLKEALKELKEIGDYQEMVIQESYDMRSLIKDEIDKKIAVLTEAKIKSFQDEDERLLGKIKFSIQVLRELKEVIKSSDVR